MHRIIAFLLLMGCDDTTFEGHGADADPVTGEGFDAVETVFSNSCLEGCHEAAIGVGGLDLETDPCGAMVGVEAQAYDGVLVVAGDSGSSVLWHKMANTSTYGGAMPPSGGIDDTSLAVVTDWIDDGALCEEQEEDTAPPDVATYYSLARVQDEVFDGSCAHCHNPNYTPPSDVSIDAIPNLEAGASHESLVGVASGYGDGRILVDPGNPEGSFLMEKLRGDPSEGKAMPRDKNAIDPALVSLVYGWILDGAQP